jgi:hypothetical protein
MKKSSTSIMTGIDPDGSISRASMDGEGAIGKGDTIAAREQHRLAGQLLLGKITSKLSGHEKGYVRFLAATQFYKGGDYNKAWEIVSKIESDILPLSVRDKFGEFRRTAKQRSRASYPQSIRDYVRKKFDNKEFLEMLQIIASHPYAWERSGMAMFRSFICAELKEYTASVSYMISALRFGVPSQDYFFQMAGFPLVSSEKGDYEGAWEHVQIAIKMTQKHAAYYLAATCFLYLAAWRSSGDQRRLWSERLLDYTKIAWSLLSDANNEFRNNREVVFFVDGMLINSFLASEWIDDKKTQGWVKDILITRDIKSPELREVHQQMKQQFSQETTDQKGESVIEPSINLWDRMAAVCQQATESTSRVIHQITAA